MTCRAQMARVCSGPVRHFVMAAYVLGRWTTKRVWACEACAAATPVELDLRPCTDGCGLRHAA